MQVMSEATDSVTSMAVRGHEILTGCVDGYVRRYDVRMGEMVSDCLVHPIICVRFTHDGNCVLATCMDNTVSFLNAVGHIWMHSVGVSCLRLRLPLPLPLPLRLRLPLCVRAFVRLCMHMHVCLSVFVSNVTTNLSRTRVLWLSRLVSFERARVFSIAFRCGCSTNPTVSCSTPTMATKTIATKLSRP